MAVPYGENQYIYGLHDPGGEHLLIQGGKAKGWILITEALGADPNNQQGKGDFYKRLADQGLGVIVRLNHAYGSSGTIPLPPKYPDFAQRIANFVRNSPGAHIWIIGNETNLEREQPRQPGTNQADPITPRLYAECYTLCRRGIKSLPGHQDDQVVIAPPGPWNAETAYSADPRGLYQANRVAGPQHYPYQGYYGDWIQYLRDMLLAIGRETCDAIAIHAYSRGYNPASIVSEAKMQPPFEQYYGSFRTYRDQMNAIPATFRDLPVYLTEMNGDVDPNGVRWPDINSGWVKKAYEEINEWNQSNRQQIRCGILYRWSKDDNWHIDGKPQVQQDLREAVAQDYTWNPDVKPSEVPVPIPVPQPIRRPAVPGYRTRFFNHNTPSGLPAGQDITVSVTLHNAGGFTWLSRGDQPFRLGFQWSDNAGQPVKLPSSFDYRTALPQDVPAGGTVTLQARLRSPGEPGVYQLRWDMVHEQVTWFTTQGDAGLLISPITVTPAAVPPTVPGRVPIQSLAGQLVSHPTKTYANRALSDIKRIIIHHTATSPNIRIQRIAEYQVNNRDLAGITYHLCITAGGQAFQTQPLTVMANHAGEFSRDSAGVCLIGNFMETPPPQAQIEAAASVLAQLIEQLKLKPEAIVGYRELARTQSPGDTWPQWQPVLLAKVRSLLAVPAPLPVVPNKPIDHYLLLWHRGPEDWAEWDLRGALEFIARFKVAVGFSIEEAKLAKAVTILGSENGVPASVEAELRQSGSQVDRIPGRTEEETRANLERLVAQGQRFRDLK